MVRVTDECDVEADVDEPSPEDFAAAEDESPQVGTTAVLARILRTAGVLFVIVALLVYFVVPVRIFVTQVVHDLRRPNTEMRKIPLAPEPTSSPTIRL